MNLKSKFLGLISAGSIVFSSVVSLLSFSVDSSVTSDIIKYTRYQQEMTSSKTQKSETAEEVYNLDVKSVNNFLKWVLDFKGALSDAIDNSETVPQAVPYEATNYYVYSGKTFVEYIDTNETITFTVYAYRGNFNYEHDVYKKNGIDIHANEILIERSRSDGSYRAFIIKPVSGGINFGYSSSGVYIVTNSDVNWSYRLVVGDSDGSETDPFMVHLPYFENKEVNNTKQNLYDFDFDSYDYRLLDKNEIYNPNLKYPQDICLIGDRQYINFNYKHKDSSSWSSWNINSRQINYVYMSYNTTNRELVNTYYQNYVINTYASEPNRVAPYMLSPLDFTNKTPYDLPEIFNNPNVLTVFPDGKIDIDTDLILELLPDLIPDFDLKIRPVFEFQPTIDAEFKLNPTLNFNYIDLFDDIVFPDLPDVPGGGGGGGGGTITPWQPPEFPEHTTSFIISAPVTTFTTDYLNADVDDEIIDMSKEIVTYGYNIWVGAGLISVLIFLTGFALVWRFTGGEK